MKNFTETLGIDLSKVTLDAHLHMELLQKMKQLLALRERMVTQRAGYTSQLGELKRIYKKAENPHLFTIQEKLKAELTKGIDILEAEITSHIKSDNEVERIYKLLISIKGIGMIVAANLIVVTRCFKAFENSRQLACHCGVAPFEKQSGTSLRSGAKVSPYADKKMKALLTNAATSAIQYDKELKAYYQRRLEKGKSKMSNINIVRNKLLHRAFAVVNRGTPFVETYQHKVHFC